MRTFAWEDPLRVARSAAGMSGLELVEAIADGSLPPPPAAEMLDMRILEVAHGRTLFGMEPQEWMYNLMGSLHGGVLATLLDTCMGCAVHTTLPARFGFTTGDLQVRYTRPIRAGEGLVLAEGSVVHRGSRTATTEGRVYLATDETQLFAHASSGCVILR
jgi:uncharacterized protein (TIGR00369 family)